MKKIMTLALLLSLLVGCTSVATPTVTNPDDVVLSIGDKTVTTEELYNTMSSTGAAEIILSNILDVIFEKHGQLDEETLAEANAQLETIKSVYGDTFESQIIGFGFESEEDFFEKNIIPSYQETAVVKKYVSTNTETVFETYKPKLVKLVEFASEEIATEALEKYNTGVALDAIAEELGTTTFTGEAEVVYTNSVLAEEIKTYINTVTTPQTPNAVIPTSTGTYYLVEIVDTDTANYADQAISILIGDADVAEDAVAYFIHEGGFKIYDEVTYEIFKATYPDFIN